MEIVLSVCLGIGLSAACGFRIFVPLLGMSIAALAGHLSLAPGFEWIGTWPAFVCFLSATILEIVAYYIPWVDNLLDSIATPAAVVAGTIITAAVITEMSPLMKWSLAAIAGGCTAGGIQALPVAVRSASSFTTGGLANWTVASTELAASIGTTIFSWLLPILTAICVCAPVLAIVAVYLRQRPAAGKPTAASP